jgi:hypothetical protein|tara:strand:- start:297 stop:587 length:291 start_codon:yes stop_codon:yes gene_type:complete
MLSLVYFILCAYGLTFILVYGSIFDKIRPKYKFFHCPLCVGFWVGVFLWSVNGFTELFTFDYNYVNALLLGCLSSGTSYALSMLIDDFGLRTSGGE